MAPGRSPKNQPMAVDVPVAAGAISTGPGASQAPSADEIIRDLQLDRTPARKILQLMVKEQAVVKIAEGMLVDSAALQKLIEDVRALKPSQASFGVKEFKELTGLSRKFAVPLLEYLDTQRVTRRVGDERIIL